MKRRTSFAWRRAVALPVVFAAWVAGCRVSPQAAEENTTEIYSRRLAEEHEFQARLSTQPRTRASHYLDAAAVWLDVGMPHRAKLCLDEARAIYYGEPLTSRTDRLLGRVYLETGELVLAERYLLRGLSRARGEEREATLARLVAVTRARGDEAIARRYRARLSRPLSTRVSAILARDVKPSPSSSAGARSLSDVLAEARRRIARSRSSYRPARATQPLRILPRSEWNARRVGRNTRPMRRIEKITVHHTGGEESFRGSEQAAADEIRRIQRYHQKQQGWADIGYHFIVDRGGNVWQGRSLKYQGAHARHENPGNIGIALLGNYTLQKVTAEQRARLESLVVALAERYSVDPRRIYTHREILDGKTACPGPEITRLVASIRSGLQTLAFHR